MGGIKRDQLDRQEKAAGKPATLSDLRAGGNDVFCWCNRCRHNAVVPLATLIGRLGPAFPVPEVGARMVCGRCGARDVATRPAWPHEAPVTRHG